MALYLIDDLTESHGNPHREAAAQGLGNFVCGWFQSMGGCAMIGQSVINVKSGCVGPHRLRRVLTPLTPLPLPLLSRGAVRRSRTGLPFVTAATCHTPHTTTSRTLHTVGIPSSPGPLWPVCRGAGQSCVWLLASSASLQATDVGTGRAAPPCTHFGPVLSAVLRGRSPHRRWPASLALPTAAATPTAAQRSLCAAPLVCEGFTRTVRSWCVQWFWSP